jgi:hypothetical protein
VSDAFITLWLDLWIGTPWRGLFEFDGEPSEESAGDAGFISPVFALRFLGTP